MAEGYLKPKQGSHTLGKRKMEDGIFRNPPTYTELGGFSSSAKYTDPAGHRQKIGKPALEKGGPTALKGKPI
jgi:hypothetical protein